MKDSNGNLWPSQEYFQQLDKLYDAIGEEVYIVPLLESNSRLTFSVRGKALRLVDIIHFSQADPEQNLFPHMLVFADGTGINLGKIMKVSKNTAFNPDSKDILYQDRSLQKRLMYAPRKLDKNYIHFVSRYALGEILGKNDIHELSYETSKAKLAVSDRPAQKDKF